MLRDEYRDRARRSQLSLSSLGFQPRRAKSRAGRTGGKDFFVDSDTRPARREIPVLFLLSTSRSALPRVRRYAGCAGRARAAPREPATLVSLGRDGPRAARHRHLAAHARATLRARREARAPFLRHVPFRHFGRRPGRRPREQRRARPAIARSRARSGLANPARDRARTRVDRLVVLNGRASNDRSYAVCVRARNAALRARALSLSLSVSTRACRRRARRRASVRATAQAVCFY